MRREFEIIFADPNSCGLGDILIMMRSSQVRDDLIYVLPKKAARMARLFDGVAPVMISNSDSFTECHKRNNTELIVLSEDELSEARRVLSVFVNPIALVVNCSKNWSHIRECGSEQWQSLVSKISMKRPVLQFGLTSNFTRLDGTTIFLDFPIRELAAMYKVIGVYMGVDTGDLHLARTFGCRCFVAVPSECPDYQYSMWHYKDDRVRYFNFDNMEDLYDSIASQ